MPECAPHGVSNRWRWPTLHPGAHWDASVFTALQQYDGLRDRQAVGVEGRYLASWASLIAIVDYDTFYRSLNTGSLLGTVQLPARWSLSFDAERRNSPVLTTRNSLIGQPDTTLAQLEQVFTARGDIPARAGPCTPITTDSAASPPPVRLGQRFQFSSNGVRHGNRRHDLANPAASTREMASLPASSSPTKAQIYTLEPVANCGRFQRA